MKIRNAAGEVEDVDDKRGQELVNLGQAAAVGDVPTIEEPSKLVSEQELRWEQAESEYATPQEKKQAAVEKAHLEASDNQPRRHETVVPTLAVPDETHTKEARKQVAAAEEELGLKSSAKSSDSDAASASKATAAKVSPKASEPSSK